MTDLSRFGRGVRVVGFTLAVLAVVWATPVASTADDSPALGISKSFAEDSVFRVLPGATLPPLQSLRIDNPSDRAAEVEWITQAPAGITISPHAPRQTIPPQGQAVIPFSIAVADTVAAGRYPVKVQVRQTNVPPGKGGITLAPAVGADFVVLVQGGAGQIVVRGVNEADGSPINGILTVSQQNRQGAPLPVDRAEGTELTTRVAPGQYLASFELPGLARESRSVTVADGQSKTVEIPVTAVQFVVADALPQPGSGDVVSARLVAAVKNSLPRQEGPFTLRVTVRLDDQEIEQVVLDELRALPRGTTDASSVYVPAAGWQPGTYSFVFELVSSTAAVSQPAQTTIVIPGSRLPLFAAAGGVLVLLGAIWWLFARRRRRDDDTGPPTRSPAATAPPAAPPIAAPPIAPPPTGPRRGPDLPPPTGLPHP